MKYDKNTVYDLRVTGTLITGDYHYFLTEDQGMKFRVKMLHFQQTLPAPEIIRCIVSGYDADGSPVFVQCKAEIARQLYALDGTVYSFTVSKKLASPGGYRNSYRGYDANGINVNIQVGGGSKLSLGRSVKGIVRHIDSEGNLTVVPVGETQEDETNFLTYGQLMHNIQVAEPPACLTLDVLRTLSDKKTEQMLAQYDSSTGLWIVSYLAVIREQRNQAIMRGDLDTAQTLIRHKLRITEWMLEDSLFLTYYSPELVGPLRQKCEREADYGETMLQAITLTRQGEAEAYLQKMFTKINTTGYLYDRERKTALLVALMQANPSLPERHTTAFIGFCHYMAHDGNTDPNNLDTLNELLRQITETAAANSVANNPRLMIRLLSVRLLMGRNRLDAPLSVCYSRLLRCACQLSPAARPVLMGKALTLLAHPHLNPAPEFGWNDLLEFNVDIFIAKLSIEMSAPDENYPPAHHAFRNHSTLLLRQGVFHLYAGCSSGALAEYQKQAEIISLLDGQVKVTGLKEFKPKMTERQNLLALKKNWEGLYRLLRLPAPSSPTAAVVQKKVINAPSVTPEVGSTVTIRLSAFNPRFPLLMFAEIVDSEYEGTGVLLANDVARYRIRSLENVFYQDDTFPATVVRSEENGRLAFSLTKELFNMAQQRLQIGKQVRAKLFKITSTSYIWIAEDGYTVHTPTPPATLLSVDDIALVRIISINAQGYINGFFLERSDMDIDPTEALGKLVAEYLDYCACWSNDDEQEEEQTRNDDPANDLSMATSADGEVLSSGVIHELVQLLSILQEIEPNLSIRYQILSAARLLAVLTDDALLVEYLSLRMNYEENIYSFATCTPGTHWEDSSHIDESAIKRFPTLAPYSDRIRALRLFHDSCFDPAMAASLNQSIDPETSHIVRLVLGHSLVHHTLHPEVVEEIYRELLRRIGAGELVPERLPADGAPDIKVEAHHLGRESGEVEFKTSIVYSAGKSLPNMKQQSDVILRTIAGLLNADGGVLHLGVADSGNVSGLANDYSYMQCNSDGYERYIRQRIIASLGKDVNGIIRIDFPCYGKHETCRITVPCHGKLVELEGAVFQRQGNSTVQLVGNALLKQQLRKQEALKTEIKTLKSDLKTTEEQTVVAQKSEQTQLVSDLLQGTSTTQTAVAAAFAASLERKSKKTQSASTGKKNPPQTLDTSRIRPNPVGKNKQESKVEVQAYLTLLENGGYLLTDELPRKLDSPSLLTLAIGAHETGGSLLLCYENACVNRIPLKALLQKKRGYVYKNGANKEAKLQWASVENGEPYLLVRIQKFANVYIKMMPMERIKSSTDLSLKGTPFYSFDFGQVTGWEAIPSPEGKKLLRLLNENLAQPGAFTTSEAVADEMELLAVLGF